MVLITAWLLSLDGSPEALDKLEQYWKYLKESHRSIYGHLRYRSLAGVYAYKNKFIRSITITLYKIVKKYYKFN